MTFGGYTFSELLLLTNALLLAFGTILVAGAAVFIFDLLRGSNDVKKHDTGYTVKDDMAKPSVKKVSL